MTVLDACRNHKVDEIGIILCGQVMVNSKTAEENQVGESTPPPSSAFLPTSLPRVHARVVNYDHIVPLKHLKANYYGKIQMKVFVLGELCYHENHTKQRCDLFYANSNILGCFGLQPYIK